MEYLQYLKVWEKIRGVIGVLNLIINGIPSIRIMKALFNLVGCVVLNLIINGIPSILAERGKEAKAAFAF